MELRNDFKYDILKFITQFRERDPRLFAQVVDCIKTNGWNSAVSMLCTNDFFETYPSILMTNGTLSFNISSGFSLSQNATARYPFSRYDVNNCTIPYSYSFRFDLVDASFDYIISIYNGSSTAGDNTYSTTAGPSYGGVIWPANLGTVFGNSEIFYRNNGQIAYYESGLSYVYNSGVTFAGSSVVTIKEFVKGSIEVYVGTTKVNGFLIPNSFNSILNRTFSIYVMNKTAGNVSAVIYLSAVPSPI